MIVGGIGEVTQSPTREAVASWVLGGIADGEALARSVLKKPVYILFVHFAGKVNK